MISKTFIGEIVIELYAFSLVYIQWTNRTFLKMDFVFCVVPKKDLLPGGGDNWSFTNILIVYISGISHPCN